MLRTLLHTPTTLLARPLAFHSLLRTSSPLHMAAPASGAAASSAGASTTPTSSAKKPKPRHRARKKPETAADGSAAASTSSSNHPDSRSKGGKDQNKRNTDAPWRGGSTRGRGGRGGGASTGGAGRGGGGGVAAAATAAATAPPAPRPGPSTTVTPARSFSSIAAGSFSAAAAAAGGSASGTTSSSAEDSARAQPFARPTQRVNAWQKPLHTDSSNASLPPPVPANATTAAKGKAPAPRPPPPFASAGKGKKIDRNEQVLQNIALKDGEEGGLEVELMRLYESQQASPEAIAARQHLVDELTRWLNAEHFRWGHAHNAHNNPLKIEPFGSVRFGLGTSSSDLDLCLLDPYHENGFTEKFFSSKDAMMRSLPDIYDMRVLGRSLQRANLMDVISIPDAAVPICKFKVEIDGHLIEVDLNTNERLGVFNSRLINSYCNLHPLVRPLSVFIKFWAKQRGLNNPSGSPTTFSSYTLILLVISYFQRLRLLPNLQSPFLIEQTNTPAARFYSTPKGRSKRWKKIMRSVGWDVTFVQYDDGPPEGYDAEPTDLVELARGFFHYFGEEFDVERDIVSIWAGEPLERRREYGELQQEMARKQQEQSEEMKRRAAILAGEAGTDHGVLSFEEEKRQEDEDALLGAFAADQTVSPEQQQHPPRPDSQASDPMEYLEFEEPERWSDHLLVVQDPFILTRNCAGNVQEDWVEELRVQFRRARDLIHAHAPLAEICANVKTEEGYKSVAERKWLERTKGRRAAAVVTGSGRGSREGRKRAVAVLAAPPSKTAEKKENGVPTTATPDTSSSIATGSPSSTAASSVPSSAPLSNGTVTEAAVPPSLPTESSAAPPPTSATQPVQIDSPSPASPLTTTSDAAPAPTTSSAHLPPPITPLKSRSISLSAAALASPGSPIPNLPHLSTRASTRTLSQTPARVVAPPAQVEVAQGAGSHIAATASPFSRPASPMAEASPAWEMLLGEEEAVTRGVETKKEQVREEFGVGMPNGVQANGHRVLDEDEGK